MDVGLSSIAISGGAGRIWELRMRYFVDVFDSQESDHPESEAQ